MYAYGNLNDGQESVKPAPAKSDAAAQSSTGVVSATATDTATAESAAAKTNDNVATPAAETAIPEMTAVEKITVEMTATHPSAHSTKEDKDEMMSEISRVSEEIVENEFDDDNDDDPTLLPERLQSTDAEDEAEDL
ncbi:hypothetical protein V9T40_008572 [Parthenolecanium corni]|uniref:Uncharacterized protein n=1 Tax=Parthenolecanium corni TaxID=536013 RepID=A0AAN9Y6Q2_9HEMI